MPALDSKFSQFADGGALITGDVVVGLRSGVNTRFSYSGGTISPGLINQLAYYAASGSTISGLATGNNGVLVTSAGGVPSISSTLPAAVQANITGLGTIATGVWNGTPVTVPYGGTGNTTFTAYSVICAGTTATGAFQNVVGVGTANQVLVSNGASALPSWQNVPGLVPAALTRVDDTNVTLTLGGTPATSLLQAVSITAGWSGQLSLARGGTNANLTAANGAIPYSTATAFALLAPGTSGQLLQSGGAGAPTWTTAAFPAAAGASGNFMQSNGTNWTSASPAALTKVDDTNVTLTLGGSPSVALMAAASMTLGWTGTLAETRGGTGNGTYTLGDMLYSSAANTLSKLAGNTTAVKQYLSQTGTGAISAAPVWATIDGGDITGAALTKVDDTNVTMTLGGTPSTALLRAASMTLGWTGQLSVSRGGTGNSTFTEYSVICAGTTATGAFQNVVGVGTAGQVLQSNGAGALPSWATIPGATSAALTRVDDTNVTLTLGGSPTTALLTATSITAGWTGQLAVSRGGTGASTLTGLLTGNGTSAFTATAITQYNVLTGGASNAPNSVAPSATSGVPLVSQGAASQPVFGTAVVAGGGTGLTTTTAYGLIAGGTTATGNFQNVGTGTSGYLLQSNGAAALPSYTTTPSVQQISWTDTTKGIVGTTTNNDAATGYVGEFVSSSVGSGAAVSLSSGVTANITNISLTAGDWDVEAVGYTTIGAGTTTQSFNLGTSSVSATLQQSPTAGGLAAFNNMPSNANQAWGWSSGRTRLSLSGTTTVYMVANSAFSVSTLSVYGWILARRVR